jgi:hypothetical protein
MTKNPFVNAIVALGYICLVAIIMNYGSQTFPHTKSIFVPIAILSLLSLSAAIMAYVFGYQPAQLFLDGKKKPAVDLFLKTVGVFALFTILLLLCVFSGIFGR